MLKQAFTAAAVMLAAVSLAVTEARADAPNHGGQAVPVVSSKSPPSPSQQPAVAAPSAPVALVDINSAGAADLQALPGIGPTRANAIIAGRPYNGKNDLVSKGIIPQGVYAVIKDRIVARQK